MEYQEEEEHRPSSTARADEAPLYQVLGKLTEILENWSRGLDKDRRTMVDTKGIGRPQNFDNTEASFPAWRTRFENFTQAIFPGAGEVMDWAADETARITFVQSDKQFGEGQTDENLRYAHLKELERDLRTALLHVLTGESFSLVDKTERTDGLEAWRLLVYRWDPVTIGGRRNILNRLINPQRQTIQTVRRYLHNWEYNVKK